MTVGAIVAVVVLAAALLAGLGWQRLSGRLRAEQRAGRADLPHLSAADIGQPLGARATLLQFSSPICAPCSAARKLLADIASGSTGVSHIELDVSSRMDLARRLDVRRTPTVFVLGPRGEIAQRASGVPRRDDVVSAVAAAAGEQQIGSDSGATHT